MTFKVKDENFIKFMQEGGVAPENAPVEEVPAEALTPEQGGDPMDLILAACLQVVETKDCQLAIQVAQAILQMAGGGVQEAPAAPEGLAPVYRKGGKLSRWISK